MQNMSSGVMFRSRVVGVSPQATPTKQVSIHVVLQDLDTNCALCKSLKEMYDVSFAIAMISFLVAKNYQAINLTLLSKFAQPTLRMTGIHKTFQVFFFLCHFKFRELVVHFYFLLKLSIFFIIFVLGCYEYSMDV